MPVIEKLAGREILDSRGLPTIEATCFLRGGATASASVPSGASVGKAEAVELRDGNKLRYRGLGCRKAAANVSGEINAAAWGKGFGTQGEFDKMLVEVDGTEDKSRLGANALLAASIAFARAAALDRKLPLWRHLAGLVKVEPATLPRLTINLFSGGKHAGAQVAIQDVLIVPVSAKSVDESLVTASAVYHAAAQIVLERYGMRLLRADEGGLAPSFSSEEEMIETALDAITAAGYKPGHDVALAVDVASTHFYSGGSYHLKHGQLTSGQMTEQLSRWVEDYPLVSVEDGLAEDDWDHWPRLRQKLEGKALVLGDDLLCTNTSRIRRAIEEKSCNALLLKVNQAGTLTEAADAYKLARDAEWMITISVRSGETEDNWAADLAVGWQGDQFKNGSITQSERLSKYNRLLQIESETGFPLVAWPRSA